MHWANVKQETAATFIIRLLATASKTVVHADLEKIVLSYIIYLKLQLGDPENREGKQKRPRHQRMQSMLKRRRWTSRAANEHKSPARTKRS